MPDIDKVVWREFASAALQGILQQAAAMNVGPQDYAHRAAVLADELYKEFQERFAV